MPEPLDPLVKAERAVQRLTIDNANLRALNKKLLRRSGGYDGFIDELKELNELEKNFKFKSFTPKAIEPFDHNHEEIACAALSDLHLSEVVRPEDCNGINIYNSVIAANRMWTYAQKLKSIYTRHMQMYNLKSIWSPLMGDIVSGTIHPEFLITNDLTDPAACLLATRLLNMFYTELKSIGIPIQIDCIHGNHPRLTIKMPTKRQAHTNLDWMIYEYLQQSFEGDDQVKLNIHTGQLGLVKIYNWNYVIEHGIGIASGKEEQYEDRIRALFDDPTFRKATGYRGPSFDQWVIGNMHKTKVLERGLVNGAFVGAPELGQAWRLKPIKATQLTWGVSKKHVRTWNYQIDLTDITSQRADNPMSDYAVWFMKRNGLRQHVS